MMYYGEVLKVKSVYKGIHPIRLSLEACKVLFNFFAKNFNLVDGVKSSQYIKFSAPYFTNNLMLIKRNTWIRGLQYPSDGFDEVPLSLMCDHQSMIRIALTGGVCIHPMYNTVYSPEEVSDFCESDGKSVESRMIATLSDKFSEIGV
jgi:hypothetical protein